MSGPGARGRHHPGLPAKSWTIAAGAFTVGYQYQWQVRTYDHLGNVSDWSNTGGFWSIGTIGSAQRTRPDPRVPDPAGIARLR